MSASGNIDPATFRSVLMFWSRGLVLLRCLSLRPNDMITFFTLSELGIFRFMSWLAWERDAPRKLSTWILVSLIRGRREILESPRINIGLVGSRDQFFNLSPLVVMSSEQALCFRVGIFYYFGFY